MIQLPLRTSFMKSLCLSEKQAWVDRDQFCAEIDELMLQGKNSIPHEAMELIHENDDCTEIRWVDGNERIVRINLKKDGLIWRSIVKRTPINN